MKKLSRMVVVLAAVVFMAGLFAPAASMAGEATDLVRETIDDVIKVLKTESLKGEAKTEARRTELRKVIRKRFGFEEMAKRSLGKHWRSLSAEERKEFTGIFGRLIENSYIDKIEGYTDEEVVYDDEVSVKRTTLVKTKLITKSGTEIPIHYKLIDRGKKGYVVYDIAIEGVSLVSTYRKQFATVMRKSSYTDLVAQLKEKL